MNVTVIGTGYVGLVTGTCLAHAGHSVTCVDIDAAKVKRMQAGKVPIYEPGLQKMFKGVLKSKHLSITTDLAASVSAAEVIFLALPTPPGKDGSADLSAVLMVASSLGSLLKRYTVVVNKSTVPVGTGEQVSERIARGTKAKFDVVSNPEFLREGLAVQDFMHPDRIVIGTSSQKAGKVMAKLYKDFIDTPEQLVIMDVRSAEMTKYAANSFLAMKLSFMNEVANLCEKLDANVDSVRLGIGPDQRIGSRFLHAGTGYGGSCFPKDVQALQHTSKQADYDFKLIKSIIEVNVMQRRRLVDKLLDYYSDGITDKRFAVWGLAFKPDTDDIREAPALNIIELLLDDGAEVVAYDPEAIPNTAELFGERAGLTFADSAEAALLDADALLIITEWEEFRTADFAAIKNSLKLPVIFDGRNIYTLPDMQKAGFDYISIGRPTITTTKN